MMDPPMLMVTNNIHIGHALNKILKDIIVKYHYFQGERVSYLPGWDCHGLPIEQQVEKNLGTAKKEALGVLEVRALCRAHAEKFVQTQQASFKDLGVIADWEHSYLTMAYQFEADIYRELCAIIGEGLLIERSKPVHWSWAAKSALAEAEIEYKNKESDSIFVAFALGEEANTKIGTKAGKFVIWTTTPWTLVANQGMALNKEATYILTDDEYIVAKELYPSLKERAIIKGNIAKTIEVEGLERLCAINPLNGRTSLIMFGEHVSIEEGTGIVHTAPGHGEEDYKIALKYGVETIMPVDERGCYDETLVEKKLLFEPQELVGEHINKANTKIIERLGEALLHHTKINHSYPHCWRTNKPTIFRATKQWFIALDKALL